MSSKVLLPVLLIASACFGTLLAFSGAPGVEDEWTWGRVQGGMELLWPLLVILFWGGGIAGLTAFALKAKDWGLRIGLSAVLAFCTALGPYLIQDNLTGPYGHTGAVWVVYYPRFSGYFSAAITDDRTTQQWLAAYDDEITEGDFLHQGTHPPGMILLFRTLDSLLTSQPWLEDLIDSSLTRSARDGFEVLTVPGTQSLPEVRHEQALIWSYLLLLHGCSFVLVLSVAGIGWLLSNQSGQQRWNESLRLGVLSAMLPGLVLFFPKSDVLFAAFSSLMALCWIAAIQKRSFLFAFLAGTVAFGGMFCSLAFVPVIAMLGSYWLFPLVLGSKQSLTVSKPALWKVAAGALMPLVLGILLLAWFDHNLLKTWYYNYQNHSEFYDHNSRSYFHWLLINLSELILALGLPVCVLGAHQLWQTMKPLWNQKSPFPRSAHTFWLLSVWGIWALLWLSGKNMGEAARLWCLFLPLLLSTLRFSGPKATTEELGEELAIEEQSTSQFSPPLFWATYCCQLLLLILTLLCVDGFHFDQLLSNQ